MSQRIYNAQMIGLWKTKTENLFLGRLLSKQALKFCYYIKVYTGITMYPHRYIGLSQINVFLKTHAKTHKSYFNTQKKFTS